MLARGRAFAAFICLVMTTTGPVFADKDSVQDTLRGCKLVLGVFGGSKSIETAEEAVSFEACLQTVDSVTTMLIYNCSSRDMGYTPLFAVDAPASSGAAMQAFVNWAEDNPEQWGETSIDGIIVAIMEAFPCQ